jgi:pimeloyl-ACP methyl ester carboxylesterase
MSLSLRKATLWTVAALVVAVAGGCGMLDIKQREFIFMPHKGLTLTPAEHGLTYDDVWLRVGANGSEQRVHGWWIPASDPRAPAMLYLHGSRFNLGSNLFRIARLHQMGFAILAIDYRGFGRSDGDLPSEGQAYEDAQAAWEELKRRMPDPARRLVYGHSLGGAIAIDLMVRRPEAAALIVESSFTSIRDMVSMSPYWFLPAGLVLTQHFDSLSKVSRLKIPVLFAHGIEDRWVPYSMSERLHAAASAPKRLLLIESAGHGNIAWIAFDLYRRAIAEFLSAASRSVAAADKSDALASRPASLATR